MRKITVLFKERENVRKLRVYVRLLCCMMLVFSCFLLTEISVQADETDTLEDLTINEDTVLEEDIYCNNLSLYADLDLNGFTVVVAGNVEGGTLILNKGQCHVGGNLKYAAIVMENEEDLLDIEGDIIGLDDGTDLSAGTIRLAGNIDSYVLCSGTHTFIFDGKTEQIVEGNVLFSGLKVENNNTIVTSEWFGLVNLLSDVKLKAGDLGLSFYNYDYLDYDVDYAETVVKTAYFNGNTLSIEGDVKIEGYIDLEGGSLNVEGNILSLNGYIYVNKGTVQVEGDLMFVKGYSFVNELSKGGFIIMASEDDLVEVHGDLYMSCGNEAVYSYNCTTYALYPEDENVSPAISAGTIKAYGDIDMDEYYLEDNIIKFAGTNKVVFCGDSEQIIYMGKNTFNQVAFENDQVVFSGGAGLGKLLTDAYIDVEGILRDVDFNGHTLEMASDTYINDLDINNGTLIVNKQFYQGEGKLLIRNKGKLHILEDYKNDWDDENGILSLQSKEDVVDVDGRFTYYYCGGLENGTLKLSGDVYIWGEDGDSFVIGSDVILDGASQQYVDLRNVDSCLGKFNQLTICQPMSNYTFKPNPCWNTLLDADGNILSTTVSDSGTNDSGSGGNTKEPTVTDSQKENSILSKGTVVTDKASAGKYKVLTAGAQPSVEFVGTTNNKKSSLTIPESITYGGVKYKVTSIKAKALKGNKKLTSVKIPSSVTTIGTSAFEGCSKLKSVTIGAGLKTIGKNVFKNCKKLTKITMKSKNLKSVGKNAFKGISAKCKIKVPKSKLKDYKKLLKGKGQKSTVKITK